MIQQIFGYVWSWAKLVGKKGKYQMLLKLIKVTSNVLSAVIPAEGELVYAVDTNQLFIGDGTTVGGHNEIQVVLNLQTLSH